MDVDSNHGVGVGIDSILRIELYVYGGCIKDLRLPVSLRIRRVCQNT